VSRDTGRIAALHVREDGGYRSPERVRFVEGVGIEGDLRAREGAKQVSLMDAAALERQRGELAARGESCPKRGPSLATGCHGENVTTEGLPPEALEIGALLRLGDEVLLEVALREKECQVYCELEGYRAGCPVPNGFLYLRVVRGGDVAVGDPVRLIPRPG
jgi:MOSC domain-containing protein YiiM